MQNSIRLLALLLIAIGLASTASAQLPDPGMTIDPTTAALVVTDPQINRFLYQTFKPKTETWIGLRYFCGFGKSLWVDGNVLSRASFNNWARVWYRNQKITCNSQRGAFEYMPVYYTPLERGFRWQASGPQKKFYSYFVEYAHKS